MPATAQTKQSRPDPKEPPGGARDRISSLHVASSAQGGKLTTPSHGLGILESVAKSQRFVTLRNVAEHFDIDRSAALRFLRTLELNGYIVRHQAMKVYSVGPKLLSFPRASNA